MVMAIRLAGLSGALLGHHGTSMLLHGRDCPRENAFCASVGKGAQSEPSAEQWAGVVVAFDSDRACSDRLGETQAAKPHRGQCRELGIDRELYLEALIG